MAKSNEKSWVCNTFATFHFLNSAKIAQNQRFSVVQEIIAVLKTIISSRDYTILYDSERHRTFHDLSGHLFWEVFVFIQKENCGRILIGFPDARSGMCL